MPVARRPVWNEEKSRHAALGPRAVNLCTVNPNLVALPPPWPLALRQHTTSEVDPGATTALSWGMSTSERVHLSHFPVFFGIRNLRLASPASGFTGQGRWPRALRSRGLCRLDVRKAAAGPRSTGSPSPRMRRVGRAAQRDDDTARRARPCACIRRYNPEEPPIPPPPRALLYLRHNRPTTHLFMA